jgi:hypothetical protein
LSGERSRRVVKKVIGFVIAASFLVLPVPSAIGHNQSFGDPRDDIADNTSDLRRVAMSHGGGRYTFKATMWDDFTNRSMRPGRGVQFELDTLDAVGEFEFDHNVELAWMRYHGRKQYRCRIYRISTDRFVGNFAGGRDGKTVKCPNIPDGEWRNRTLFDWNVNSFYGVGLDASGPHQHAT